MRVIYHGDADLVGTNDGQGSASIVAVTAVMASLRDLWNIRHKPTRTPYIIIPMMILDCALWMDGWTSCRGEPLWTPRKDQRADMTVCLIIIMMMVQ